METSLDALDCLEKLRELLKENTIGRLQLIQAAFGFPLTDPSNIRMNPALAGGALMDAVSRAIARHESPTRRSTVT